MGKTPEAVAYSIPKYSKYEIKDLILKTPKPVLNKEETGLYEQLISNTLLRERHYRLASEILDIPFEKFFESEEETEKEMIFYRADKENFEDEIKPIINMFRFYAEQSKLQGFTK